MQSCNVFGDTVSSLSSQSIVITSSVVAWSWDSALYVFCGSILFYSPSLHLSPVYLTFLPSSWLEYWWSSLWIWLNPCSAESDSRHKYLGASKRETSWLQIGFLSLIKIDATWPVAEWLNLSVLKRPAIISLELISSSSLCVSIVRQSFSEDVHPLSSLLRMFKH